MTLVLLAAAFLPLADAGTAARKQAHRSGPTLMDAVQNKQYATMSALLRQGANVNTRDMTGRTALMLAAWQSDARATGILLSHGARVNLQDKQGLTALWIATERGDIAITTGAEVIIVRQLLKHGAKVDVKEKHGDTVFDLIREMERPDPMITLLLKQARARQHRRQIRHK